MESTYWIRYSDYEVYKDEQGTEYIRPAANSVPLTYDVAANLGNYVAELVAIALDDHDELARSLKFCKRFGLLGLAMADEYSISLPEKKADMESAAFKATGRKDESYAGVFSPDYMEKTANISAWLDWTATVYNRAQRIRNGKMAMASEPFTALSLQTMLETGLKQKLADETLTPCRGCGKIFYHEDPSVETCSEKCELLYDNIRHLEWMKDNLHIKPISGG